MRHLVRMASYHLQTNMHARNLAIVWAPNLLRSKDIETSGFNGTAAFMEVRIQSIVVEFILTHVEQLFGDAPLSGSDRESFRKSLLLPTFSSQVAISDEKYCLSYNVPTMLNQGDGPPQMRPYHTIIELTDHKKVSLKVKKWRSIFNLGRSSHDSKRKLNKAEDKDDKSEKVSLRSAKSMDSLSSMPNTSINDDAGVGRKRSQKELGKRRESFDSPSSHEESFLESDEYPDGKVKGEEGQGESEGEATVKSEPTTPKAKRASLVGGTPQGRSPKAARNRAEKCAGVHISGPFSVTVPFHITSNLTLSRLTRGLECPALSYRSLDTEAAESSLAQAEENSGQKEEEDKVSQSTTSKAGPMEAEPKMESLPGLEEKRLSLEVDDSFSFLDTWQEYSIEGDQPQKKSLQETAHDVYMDSMMGGCPLMDDDIGSGLMNEMIGAGMQPEEFSSMDYLSIEDCMNEYPEEEADRFYVASSCLDNEEPFMEMDPEEVFHSAYDDLSPLATELKKIQQLVEDQSSELGPSEDVLDGDVVQESLGEQLIRPSEEGILPKDLSGGSLSEKDRITSASSSPHVPELTESYWSEDTALGHGNNDNQPWTPLKDVAETTATETDLTMKELEDATLRDGVDPMKTSHSVQRESPHPTPNDVPEEKSESYLAPERENQPSRSSHERDGQLEALGLSEREQVLCAPGMSAHAQKEVGKSNGQVGSSGQEKMSESGKGSPQLLATDASSSPVICPGPPLLLGTCLPVDPLLETETSNERSPNPTPFLDTGPEVLSLIEDFPDAATL
uniref:Rho GTPase activating protein 30 n=1 Tax=Sphenodon punctatus TaxID=8508 RepID=A0A8D0GVI8_SPHPU